MAAAWAGQNIAIINEGGIRTGLEQVRMLYIRKFFYAKAGQCSFHNLPLPSLPLSLLGPVTIAAWSHFAMHLIWICLYVEHLP